MFCMGDDISLMRFTANRDIFSIVDGSRIFAREFLLVFAYRIRILKILCGFYAIDMMRFLIG